MNEASSSTASTSTIAGNGSPVDESEIALFGDPRSGFVHRGPDRRRNHTTDHPAQHEIDALRLEVDRLSATHHAPAPGRALRLGRGDGFATALNILGLIVFVATIVASSLIFYNAQNVGAFSDPWDSSRVAIGFAVLGMGIVHSAVLIGVARAITYQLATLRLKMREAEGVAARTPTRV